MIKRYQDIASNSLEANITVLISNSIVSNIEKELLLISPGVQSPFGL